MSIAAIMLIGNKVKILLNNRADIINVDNAAIHCEYFEEAQLLTFNAVLTKTAVAGIHHINQDPIFTIALPNISLSLSKDTFVIFSQIFHDIIVSNIVTIAITAETFIISNIIWLFDHIVFNSFV